MIVIQEKYTPTGEIGYAHIGCFAKNMGMSESEAKEIKSDRRYGKFLVSLVEVPNGKECHSCEEAFEAEQEMQQLDTALVAEQETPGWPPSAQETVYYQEVMAKPAEF